MQLPYLADAKSFEDAADLMHRFGEDAGSQAAARADHSLDLGNHVHFCHWRQIERLIVILAQEAAFGTVH